MHKLIDWQRVRGRLERYPVIAKSFPEEMLKERSDKPPYYCHYMAWRLGTWSTYDFGRLDDLLTRAERLPNWENEKPLLGSPDYGTFWSLVWQLQVAEHLCGLGTDVRWGAATGGPDLSVTVGGERWYVECYSIQKSYGLPVFLQELLNAILAVVSVQTEYQRFLPLSLPKWKEAGQLLDKILKPYCSKGYLERARASDVAIVCRTSCCEPLVVSLTGKHEYVPDTTGSGSPRQHVRVMLAESVRNKKKKNQLDEHPRNILAVNLLLTDSQVASSLRPHVIRDQAPDVTDTPIDVLAVATGVGIDEQVGAQLAIASCRGDEWRRQARWIEANSSLLN